MALSSPAFAILLRIVVESDVPLTHEAVPITTAGPGSFLVAATTVLVELVLATESTVAKIASGPLALGMASMLVGAGLIGPQTRRGRRQQSDVNGRRGGLPTCTYGPFGGFSPRGRP